MDDVLILNAPPPVDTAEIRRRLVPLLERHGVVEAYLIGSYARQAADAWSDVDLVLVKESDEPFVERGRSLGEILGALPVAVDLLVYTPEEFARGMQRGFGIFDAISREGVSLL